MGHLLVLVDEVGGKAQLGSSYGANEEEEEGMVSHWTIGLRGSSAAEERMYNE